MTRVVLDTSVLVGGMDRKDSQHARAVALLAALDEAAVEILLLDFVVIECIGVMCRRRAERRRPAALPDLNTHFPAAAITNAYALLAGSWNEILDVVMRSQGALNAHDALLLAFARREQVGFIATFDEDLAGHGVDVIDKPDDVPVMGTP